MADRDERFDELGSKALEGVEGAPPSRSDQRAMAKRNRTNRDTAKAAANLKLSGYQDYEIADLLEYATPGAARAAYEHVFAEAGDLEADLPAARRVVSQQYDAVLKSLANKALHEKIRVKDADGQPKIVDNPDHLQYAAAFVRVLDRKAVLHGLNAPQMLAITNPDAAEFSAVVSKLLQAEGVEEVEEGDIWDAEVVEDDEDGS